MSFIFFGAFFWGATRQVGESASSETLRALSRVGTDGPEAVSTLFPLVYDEIRALAGACMKHERAEHTLQPTALANEVYVKLVGQSDVSVMGRAHLLAMAAKAIRRVLVDHARGRARAKRGGGLHRLTLSGVPLRASADVVDVLAIDDALAKLHELDPFDARIVELRFFSELTLDEMATVLNVSERTIRRHWEHVRIWLQRELGHGDPPPVAAS